MQIQHLAIESLTIAVNNSRTHSDEQVAQIAASIKEFGFTNPVLIDEDLGIIAGHGRCLAAEKLELPTVPCLTLHGLSDVQKRAYMIADNQLPINAGWDLGVLKMEVEALQELDFDIDMLGFDVSFLDSLLDDIDEATPPPDATPDVFDDPFTVEGDVWILGEHRVMCGDSTSVDAVIKLCNGETAALLHADPPYGMGKESDGVANDNIYREELDRFQMEWWTTFRMFIQDNASAYIWGNAPELWRLWYSGGLADSERLELRNEIVWDKKSVPGMASEERNQYSPATERCLFFQVGDQFIGNINADQYWEGWDEIRVYLETEAKAAGLTPALCRKITDVQMYAHWFSKSQWSFIPENHYELLQSACPGNFEKPYKELRTIYVEIKGGYRSHVNGILGGMRSYFDNAHDIMRDVWEFPRVVGDERYGHATPKPVEMMERVMRSSLPRGGLCLEPFGGSGSTLIAAERTNRRCFTMELQPKYVDVIIRRWEKYTNKDAVHEDSGLTYSAMSETNAAI